MLDSEYWMLDAGCRLLDSVHPSLVAGIVNSESYLLIYCVFWYSFFYHYNRALIFSELFLEFKHIFREYDISETKGSHLNFKLLTPPSKFDSLP